MPVNKLHGTSSEEVIANIRQEHFIGIFKIMLSQTQNHPDQRALDQGWVDQLIQLIGSPDTLNRAWNPISVVLLDDKWYEKLEQLKKEHPGIPTLPIEIIAQVFAGQHRLAMLSQLGLEGPEQLWWHAEVYKKELETNHPAEFLTMMHESNTPQIMKAASDAELFRAVYKLKGLLSSGTISQQTFLQNRRMLLRGEETNSRAISNLTRNDDLANAIAKALTREHIAKEFTAGSWKRLTTGRLYMVAAGLVAEMVAQVDQLMEGMLEVPQDVLSLPPRTCLVSKIGAHTLAGKKKAHPWDQLPGKRTGALKRVVIRPATFVSNLNPKTADPWSLPHIVLLPSCLGSKFVEDELKQTQTVTQHLLKMILTEDKFVRFHKGQNEAVEDPNDHPAGLISGFVAEKHPGQQNVVGFELKIMHILWKSRESLHEELKDKNIPDIDSSSEADYQRLLMESQPWWDLMRKFKMRKLQSRFNLSVPKEFGIVNQAGSSEMPPEAESPTQDTPASPVETSQASKRSRGSNHQNVRRKRAKGNLGSPEVQEEEDWNDEEGGNGDEQQPGPSHKNNRNNGAPMKLMGQEGNRAIEVDESEESQEEMSGLVQERRGGDRRLARVLERITSASDVMTRVESRAITELLEQVMGSRANGDMETLVSALVKKGKTVLAKLEKRREADYDTPDEQGLGQNGQTTEVEDEMSAIED
ncbi:hypothetical protein FRC11_011275 [Ceratobasidium sp. 423]|nr:hypothetical protein FRC11_011275 [Ceratobasidium sp. 423]